MQFPEAQSSFLEQLSPAARPAVQVPVPVAQKLPASQPVPESHASPSAGVRPQTSDGRQTLPTTQVAVAQLAPTSARGRQVP